MHSFWVVISQPEKSKMVFRFVFFLFLLPTFGISQNQEVVTFLSYNLLNYRNETSFCTNTNNSPLAKENYFKTIFQYAKPDLIACNEVGANASNAAKILERCLNVDGETKYVMAPFTYTSGSNLANAFYYNSEEFALYSNDQINSEPGGQQLVRLIDVFRLYYQDANLVLGADTTFLTVFVAHLKAGDSSSDAADRAEATDALMEYIVSENITGNYIVAGDFNVYTSSENAFQNLIAPSNSSIAFIDPVNRLGAWNNNGSFADVHTQSTHFSSNGCASGGGLDDRFDFILVSDAIKNNSNRIESIKSSYKAIANDGNHFNQSINNPANTSVPADVLDAIYNGSDHLPVVLDMIVTQAPPNGIANVSSEFSATIQNPGRNQISGTLEGVSGNYHITIYSLTGRVLQQQNFYHQNTTEFSLPLRHRGMVLIEISDDRGFRQIQKVIVN